MYGYYQMYIDGPTIRTLSGNSDGSGPNLVWHHYLTLGYKVSSKWRVSATQPFNQYIDDKPSSVQDPFVVADPYFSVANPKLLDWEKQNTSVYFYARYYAPFSRPTRQAADKAAPTDSGYGQVRLFLDPIKTWKGGALALNFQTLLQYRIASSSSHRRAMLNKGDPTRQDAIFVLDPVLSYDINSVWEPYLEYATELDHSTNGHWTPWYKGDYVSPGFNINASKRLFLNPYLLFDPSNIKDVKFTQVGFQVVYTFL
jgi:hypothetical protein